MLQDVFVFFFKSAHIKQSRLHLVMRARADRSTRPHLTHTNSQVTAGDHLSEARARALLPADTRALCGRHRTE